MDAQSPDAPPPRLAPGYRLAGRLRLGADATIYQAVQESDQRNIVLKVFHSESYPIEQAVARLRRLPPHPAVVRVLGSGRTEDGLPYLAMAHYPEGSYQDRIARAGPLSVAEAIRVAQALADALGAVHAAGLVHGDVTPANTLCGRDGPVLTDFAVPSAAEAPGTVALDRLTPSHAAPEVLPRRSADARSDIYGLGSTIWTLLAGHPPFAAAGRTLDPFEYRERALSLPVPAIPRADVPWWLQEIVRRAMAKRPADRFQDAAAFAAALRDREGAAAAAFHGSVLPHPAPATHPPPPPSHRPEPWTQPSPALAVDPGERSPGRPPAPRPGARSWVDVRPQPSAPVGWGPPVRPGGYPWRQVRLGRLMLVGTGVAAVLLGAVLIGQLTRPDQATPPAAPADATASAPTDLELADERVAVTVSWRDASDGEHFFTVIGGPVDAEPGTLGVAGPGQTSLRVNGLNPELEYCFRVLATVSTDADQVLASEPECTTRFADQTPTPAE